MSEWRNPKTFSVPFAGDKVLRYETFGFEGDTLAELVAAMNAFELDLRVTQDPLITGIYLDSVHYQGVATAVDEGEEPPNERFTALVVVGYFGRN